MIIIITSMTRFCSSQSHYGKEFYFGMPHNSRCLELSLDIASLYAGNYTLRVPFLHRLDKGEIQEGLTNIKLSCYITRTGSFVDARGIFLETNVSVAVFGTNYFKDTAEIFLALPTQKNGLCYNTAGYMPFSNENSYVLVAAARNGTNVTIFDNSIGKVLQNSSLNKLDLLQYSSADDLQGVTVESDGPVSVVAGTSCTNIPKEVNACDTIFEQMIPTDTFESIYIVPPTPPKQAYELRVTNVQNVLNSTVCFYNITGSVCKNDSTISVRMGVNPTVIISCSPVGVFQYGYGNGYPKVGIGDPFMTVIPGLGQFLNRYYFAIPDVYSEVQNHISIIIQKDSLSGLSLDNTQSPVGTRFGVAKPLQNYTVLNLKVSSGYHLVEHNDSNVKFGLLVYGFGEVTDTFIGYGYPGGMGLSKFDTTETRSATTSTKPQNKSSLTRTNQQSSRGDKGTGKQDSGEGSEPLGVILGVVMGTAAAIALLACTLYLFVWKKREGRRDSSVEPERAKDYKSAEEIMDSASQVKITN